MQLTLVAYALNVRFGSCSISALGLMRRLHAQQMRLEGLDNHDWQERPPILRAFALPDDNLPVIEVHVPSYAQ